MVMERTTIHTQIFLVLRQMSESERILLILSAVEHHKVKHTRFGNSYIDNERDVELFLEKLN